MKQAITFICIGFIALCSACSNSRPQTQTEIELGEAIGTIGTVGPVSIGYMGPGAAFTAQYLDTETYQISFVRSEAPKTVDEVVVKVLSEKGRPASDRAKGANFDYAALVGSGVGGLNPAMVKIAVRKTEDGKTKIIVQGTAKEGWIKQNTSEKAVKSVAYDISEQLNTSYLEKRESN